MAASRLTQYHTYLGLVLLLPLLGWTFTGIVFLIKPGYEGAYQQLELRTYPIERQFVITAEPEWREYRLLHTVLGYHLMVKTQDGALHLDPATLSVKSLPNKSNLERLISDALAVDRSRYGKVKHIEGLTITTDSKVEIDLDWTTLSLRQRGIDTKIINTLYKIHYLQWLGIPAANMLYGALGVFFLICLVALGVTSFVKREKGADKLNGGSR